MLSRVTVFARRFAAPIVMRGADRLSLLHWELGIGHEHLYTLPPHELATDLVQWGSHRLTSHTLDRWLAMRGAAAADGIELRIVSAFRDWNDQADRVRQRLRWGQPLTRVLKTVAPPGYSEHHTGCALDLTTPGCTLIDEFEHTPAYEWLCTHAVRFGFTLSYPRGNAWGIRFEPWHWCLSPIRSPLAT